MAPEIVGVPDALGRMRAQTFDACTSHSSASSPNCSSNGIAIFHCHSRTTVKVVPSVAEAMRTAVSAASVFRRTIARKLGDLAVSALYAGDVSAILERGIADIARLAPIVDLQGRKAILDVHARNKPLGAGVDPPKDVQNDVDISRVVEPPMQGGRYGYAADKTAAFRSKVATEVRKLFKSVPFIVDDDDHAGTVALDEQQCTPRPQDESLGALARAGDTDAVAVSAIVAQGVHLDDLGVIDLVHGDGDAGPAEARSDRHFLAVHGHPHRPHRRADENEDGRNHEEQPHFRHPADDAQRHCADGDQRGSRQCR